jgi:serine/threonine protein kinase
MESMKYLFILFFLLRRSLKSDVWSVGICIYELITHSYPFKEENYYKYLDAILNKKIETFEGNCSHKFKQIVCKMLIKV